MKKRLVLFILVIVCSIATFSFSQENKHLYKIGILVNSNKPEALQKWRYTAKYLSDHINDSLFVIIPLDFHEVEDFVKKGKVDLLIADPYFFIALKEQGYLDKILTLKDYFRSRKLVPSTFGSVIFFRKDRKDISNITDMKEKNFVAVDPKSIGGWLAAAAAFKNAGIDPYTDLGSLSFVGSQDDAVFAVLYGAADAGCVRTGVLENMYLKGLININDIECIQDKHALKHVVYISTPCYSEWLLMKTSRISTAMADEITTVLLTMEPDTLAAVSGEYAGWTIAGNYSDAEKIMKDLKVGPFVNYGKISVHDIFLQFHDWILAIVFLGLFLVLFIIKARLEIHKRKITEAELVNNRDRLNAVMNSSNAIISVFNIFGDFTVLFSKLASKIGYSLNVNMAHNIKSYIHPDDALSFMQHLTHVIETKTEVSSVQYRIRYKDQLWYWQEANISPLPHTNEAVVVGIDISEKLETEKQMEKQKSQLITLSTAIEQSPSVTVLTDLEGKIEYANPKFSEVTGYSFEEVKGKNPNILRSSDSPGKLYEGLWNTITAGKPWKGIFENKKKDGSLYWEEAIIAPIKNDFGVITNYIKISQDITDKRIAEQKTKEALKVKADFISMVTHEIRTPMTAIKEGINMLFELPGAKLEDQQEHLLKIVQKNVNRFGQLVNDVLDFQKLDAGRMNFVFKDVDLNVVIKDSIEGIRSILNDKSLALAIDLDPKLPIIQGDENRIIQVLTNILHNAIKFTAKGTIHVSSSIADQIITIAIKDSGIGIPEKDVDRIFHRFEQAKNIHAKYKGTGLGLAISLEIMKAHNGNINVKSKEGKGTTFYLTFPLSTKKEGPDE